MLTFITDHTLKWFILLFSVKQMKNVSCVYGTQKNPSRHAHFFPYITKLRFTQDNQCMDILIHSSTMRL